MLLQKSSYVRSFLYFQNQFRYVSGYKIGPDNYRRTKHPSNMTEEDKEKEKIELAVRRKARSRLRGFQKISADDLFQSSEGPDPNEQFRDKPHLPVYRSTKRYLKTAERERRRQREEGVWWKNLDYWIKEREGLNDSLKDIGFILEREKCTNEIRNTNRKNPVLEKAAREHNLIIDCEEVFYDWERSSTGISHIKNIAHYYNIYKDLFKDGDFYPVLHMDIDYVDENNLTNPVFYGNELLPSETKLAPVVTFEPKAEKLYTLLLTSPDEHLEDNDKEYVHWLVGNIPVGEVAKGDVLVDYLQPIPARGTGYQRMIYVLFEQNNKIDFGGEKREMPCTLLRKRDFSTFQFYNEYSSQLTPASLRFFQCKWDSSVKDAFHHVLKMKEPVYEYEKLSEKPRLGILKNRPKGKTLEWLAKFMPKEMVYPDGSRESVLLRRQAAQEASRAIERPNRVPKPVSPVYVLDKT